MKARAIQICGQRRAWFHGWTRRGEVLYAVIENDHGALELLPADPAIRFLDDGPPEAARTDVTHG